MHVSEADLAEPAAPDSLRTHDPQAVLEQASRLVHAGNLGDAIELVGRHLSEAPGDTALALAMADLYQTSNSPDRAIEVLSELCSRVQGCAIAHHRLAGLLRGRGDLEAAIASARRAVAIAPDWADAHNRLGTLLEAQDPRSALLPYAQAAELAPNWYAPRYNQACALRTIGEHELAIGALNEAIACAPEQPAPHLALAELLLMTGQFAQGWREYEWRFGNQSRVPAFPGTTAPIWRGQRLNGEIVMVWLEQGLGDQLQFSRYLQFIQARGGRVWIQVPRALRSLFGTLDCVERMFDEGVVPKGFDFQIPLMSLPNLISDEFADPPALDASLSIPSELAVTTEWLSGTAQGLRLRAGLVWASRADHPSAARRDCPLEALATLADLPGLRLYSLQFGPDAGNAIRQLGAPIIDLGPVLGDLAQTAARVRELDLVITVDTAMAHLCGALGHPVWVLLSEPADWRWQLGRDDSIWYPSMRLFRQREPGQWGSVIEDVRAALIQTMDARGNPSSAVPRS